MDLLDKKMLSTLDLCLTAARKRQSPRTGFVHLHHGDPIATDTIPVYDNLCFALALCRQKKAESIAEAKELLQKLLFFQNPDGNFPTYVHEFPRAYNANLSLQAAPILHWLLREFGAVLGSECRMRLESSLHMALKFAQRRLEEGKLTPMWALRYRAMRAAMGDGCDVGDIETGGFTPADWWEYSISKQLTEVPKCSCFHLGLQAYCGHLQHDRQTHFEPDCYLIEWAAAAAMDCFSPRLLKDDPRQIQLAALGPIEVFHKKISAALFQSSVAADCVFRVLWGGSTLHSLVLPKGDFSTQEIDGGWLLDLPSEYEMGRDDLIECALYCDISSDTKILINGERGTVFNLDDTVEIVSLDWKMQLKFEVEEGEGEFCGHLLFGNRPGQTSNTEMSAYDWKIALRTLRRSPTLRLKISKLVLLLII